MSGHEDYEVVKLSGKRGLLLRKRDHKESRSLKMKAKQNKSSPRSKGERMLLEIQRSLTEIVHEAKRIDPNYGNDDSFGQLIRISHEDVDQNEEIDVEH